MILTFHPVDSDEDEGVGAIRIRDFGSIKEISEDEDDDDDVVEIPQIKIHTNRVKMEDEPEYADLDMDCVEEGGITTTVRPRNVYKIIITIIFFFYLSQN